MKSIEEEIDKIARDNLNVTTKEHKENLRKFASDIVREIVPDFQNENEYPEDCEKIVIGHNKTVNEIRSNSIRIGIDIDEVKENTK